MKKYLILFMFCVFSGQWVCAQTGSDIKKVAILEVVDKADAVPYGVKLLLRTSLAQAIAITPGYEGYDRVDMAAIQDEQEFQRTGLVSDDDIKRLGELTGADYVLVAEVAKIDQVNIIITAKILNVETAKLEMSSYEQSNTGAYEIEQSCRKLASRLLGQTSVNRNGQSASGKKEKVKKPKSGRKATATLQLDDNSKVFRKGNRLFMEDERMLQTKLTTRQAQIYLNEHYNAWAQAKHRRNCGVALASVGWPMGVAGLGMVLFKNEVVSNTGLGVMIAGGLLGLIGTTICGVQSKKMDVILTTVNKERGVKQKVSLTLGDQPHGFGLGLKF